MGVNNEKTTNNYWVKFDMRSNYWYLGSLTKVRVY